VCVCVYGCVCVCVCVCVCILLHWLWLKYGFVHVVHVAYSALYADSMTRSACTGQQTKGSLTGLLPSCLPLLQECALSDPPPTLLSDSIQLKVNNSVWKAAHPIRYYFKDLEQDPKGMLHDRGEDGLAVVPYPYKSPRSVRWCSLLPGRQ